jgi:3'-phosphoadenosine 5'-phosphosulfate sulfotransferase (PAPS reductase)/FAD synthetase
MRHVVMLSGGVSSWATGKRVAERHGTDDLTLLFADTRQEEADSYRFLEEGAADIGGELVRIAEGRTVWEVFHDEHLIGNSQKDPCSRILKREVMRRWLEENRDPAETTCYVGFDWTEPNRIERSRKFWDPWSVEFPLGEWRPFMWKNEVIDWCRAEGIDPPALTRDGFPHANCGGACIKAGQVEWRRTLFERPKVYAEWEAQEERFRAERGDFAVLRHRSGPDEGKPLPLRVFRRRMEEGQPCDLFDSGGCGCMDPGEIA